MVGLNLKPFGNRKLNAISRAEIKSLIEENSGVTVNSVKKTRYSMLDEKPTKEK